MVFNDAQERDLTTNVDEKQNTILNEYSKNVLISLANYLDDRQRILDIKLREYDETKNKLLTFIDQIYDDQFRRLISLSDTSLETVNGFLSSNMKMAERITLERDLPEKLREFNIAIVKLQKNDLEWKIVGDS